MIARTAAIRFATLQAAVEPLERRVLFSTAGDLDSLFGSGGIVTQDFLAGNDFAFASAIQSDGKILVAGRARSNTGTGNDFGVMRFNPDGSLDASFGVGGIIRTDLGTTSDSAY